jgi:hypothetical protein
MELVQQRSSRSRRGDEGWRVVEVEVEVEAE